MSFQDTLLALCVAFIWGINFVFVKIGLHEFPPFLFVALRYLVAVLPVLFVPRPKVPWWILIGIGFFLGTMKFAFMFLGLHLGMDAGVSSLVLQSHVFFTIALSLFIFRNQLTRQQALGIMLAFLGIACIGFDMHEHTSFWGFCCLLAAAFSWAIANILTKCAPNVEAFSLVVWTGIVPPIPMLICSYFFEGGMDQLIITYERCTWVGILCVLHVSLMATLLGATLWVKLLAKYPASVVAPFSLLIPVFGLLSSWIVLDENVSLMTGVACVIVFVGLAINQWRYLPVSSTQLKENDIPYPKAA